MIEPVLAPFMFVQRNFGPNNVMGGMVVPLMCYLSYSSEAK